MPHAAELSIALLTPLIACMCSADATLQHDGPQDLDTAEPVTTVAPDANVVKDQPNLPADEFEALTSAYKGAPLPPNEDDRNASLCRLEQLDTPEDPRFDDITQLVRRTSGQLRLHIH